MKLGIFGILDKKKFSQGKRGTFGMDMPPLPARAPQFVSPMAAQMQNNSNFGPIPPVKQEDYSMKIKSDIPPVFGSFQNNMDSPPPFNPNEYSNEEHIQNNNSAKEPVVLPNFPEMPPSFDANEKNNMNQEMDMPPVANNNVSYRTPIKDSYENYSEPISKKTVPSPIEANIKMPTNFEENTEISDNPEEINNKYTRLLEQIKNKSSSEYDNKEYPEIDDDIPLPPEFLTEKGFKLEEIEPISPKKEVKINSVIPELDYSSLGHNVSRNEVIRKISSYEPGNPLFINVHNFKTVLSRITDLKKDLKESEDIVVRMNEIKVAKDKEFGRWREELDDIQKKLLYIDKMLFEAK